MSAQFTAPGTERLMADEITPPASDGNPWDDPPTHPYICPRCLTKSWHPMDIRERYCARCKTFSEQYPGGMT